MTAARVELILRNAAGADTAPPPTADGVFTIPLEGDPFELPARGAIRVTVAGCGSVSKGIDVDTALSSVTTIEVARPDSRAVVMPRENAAPAIGATLVDDDRRPLADCEVAITVDPSAPNRPIESRPQFARSDATGRVVIPMADVLAPGEAPPARIELELRHHAMHPPMVREVDRFGIVDVARVDWAQGRDVGTVVLRERPVLLSGRVVDERGQMAQGVFVRLTGVDCPLAPRSVVVTDGEGVFVALGDTASSLLHVRLGGLGFEGRDVQIEREPSTEPTLEIRRTRGISLSVRTDPWAAPLVAADWIPSDTAGTSVRIPVDPFQDHVALSATVAPGVGTLRFRLGRSGAEALRIDDVLVGDDGHVDDPRLVGLDLRGRIRLASISVVDDEGHPVDEFACVTECRSDWAVADSTDGVRQLRGRCLVPTTDAGVTVWIAYGNGRVLTVDGVTSDREVVVPRGIPVAICLAGPLPELRGRARLLVRLHGEGGSAEAAVAPDGSALAWLPAFGTYRAEMLLQIRPSTPLAATPSPRTRFGLGIEGSVTCTEGQPPPTLNLRAPTQSEVDARLQRR